MNPTSKADFIDIHTHHAKPASGVFTIESLLAHENRLPEPVEGIAYTAGIHPWYLSNLNKSEQVDYVRKLADDPKIIAIGEAGFDRLKGPDIELQRQVFEEQVAIADRFQKPVVIHCVRSWDELLSAHKKLKPGKPWLVHGFRGKKDLAKQLLVRGMYLSFWFDFVVRPESEELLAALPKDRIFLETDGADIDIRNIYRKVAKDLNIEVEELKAITYNNFNSLFCD
jgi:TatD DNase family protein